MTGLTEKQESALAQWNAWQKLHPGTSRNSFFTAKGISPNVLDAALNKKANNRVDKEEKRPRAYNKKPKMISLPVPEGAEKEKLVGVIVMPISELASFLAGL